MDEFDVIAWQHLTGEVRRAQADALDCALTCQPPGEQAERWAEFRRAIRRAIDYKEHLDDREGSHG